MNAMKAAHSPGPLPGPWTFDHDGERFFVYCDSPDGDNCPSVCDMCKWQSDELQEATAALIASAPDLLEACKHALVAMKNGLSPDLMRAAEIVVRAAIAKATVKVQP